MTRPGKLAAGISIALIIAAAFAVRAFRETSPADRKIDERSGSREAFPHRKTDIQPSREIEPAPAAQDKKGFAVAGRILKRIDAAPVPSPGVTVRAKTYSSPTDEKGSLLAEVKTGEDGRFEITGLPLETVLTIEIDEPSSALEWISLYPRETRTRSRKDLGDILLEPALSFTVKLSGEEGEPLGKGRVALGRRSDSYGPSEYDWIARESGIGEYIIERLPSGSHDVLARSPGHSPEQTHVELPREGPLPIRLLPGKRIAGIVHDRAGKPIAGARVLAKGNYPFEYGFEHPAVVTDGSGRFTIDTLLNNRHEISVEADGYVTLQEKDLHPGLKDIEITLAHEAVFSGRVVADDDGSPVQGATVFLVNSSERTLSAGTDALGFFEIRKLPGGTRTIIVEHDEFLRKDLGEREIREGEKIAGQVIRLDRGLALAGRLVDADGERPIPDGEVSFSSEVEIGEPLYQRTVFSDGYGIFHVKGLREGGWEWNAAGKGYLSSKGKIDIPPSKDSVPLTIRLERGASISGRVLDPEGRPLPGACVFGFLPDDGKDVTSATDIEGRFLLEGLPPNLEYSIHTRHRSYIEGSAKGIALEPKGIVEGVEIRLLRGGRIRGRVLDGSGRGLAGATVTWEGPGVDRVIRTDAEGLYEISRLEPGSYKADAEALGFVPGERSDVQVSEGAATESVDFILDAGASFRGRVVDSSGDPLPDVYIYISSDWRTNDRFASSDRDGKFELRGFTEGRYNFQADKEGFEGRSISIILPAEDVLITLTRLARLTGNVRAEGAGSLSDLEVEAFSHPEGDNFDLTPRPDGSGAFDGELPPGSYVIWASIPGFAPGRSEEISLKEGELREGIAIELGKGGAVQGTAVLGKSGEPAVKAEITLTLGFPGFSNAPGTEAGPEGGFHFENIPEGKVNIWGRLEEATGHAEVQVRAGETARVRLELRERGGISGAVTRGGKPVPKADVFAGRDGQPIRHEETDEDGEFHFVGLDLGPYTMWIGEGGFPMKENVAVEEGKTTEVSFAAERAAPIRLFGTVSSRGKPLKEERVQAEALDGPGRISASTDSKGDYSMDLPGPGAYRLRVEGGIYEVSIPEGVDEHRRDIDVSAFKIRGIVADAGTGAPLGGAEIAAILDGTDLRSLASLIDGECARVRSDDFGRFVFEGIPPGPCLLWSSAEGYAPGIIRGTAGAEEDKYERNRLALLRGIGLRARILDPAGRPVARSSGILRDWSGAVMDTGLESGEDGILEIGSLLPGNYRISVFRRPFALARAALQVPGGAQEPEIVLRPGGRLEVRASEEGGRPAAGAAVEIIDGAGENLAEEIIYLYQVSTQGRSLARPLTDSGGSLTIDPMPPGTYRVMARKGPRRGVRENVIVSEGRTAEAHLSLEPPR